VWEELAARQHGVITRRQALAGGLTSAAINRRLRAGTWRRLYTGVYVTFTGPVPRSSSLWAVVLRAGPGAMLSHETAAELAGLIDEPAGMVHVTVPPTRRGGIGPGIRRHISEHARAAIHPTREPPQTRIEETVVDLTQTARDPERAIAWVVRACARRLTTVDRLRDTFAARRKLRWRGPLWVALGYAEAGCHSTLELAYLRSVERRHGLPAARRQAARRRRGGRWYDDVLYEQYRTLVELDGQRAHPPESRDRDRRRDNAAVAANLRVLRYGAAEVLGHPCEVAREVGAVLRLNGWQGRPRPCGPACPAPLPS
jgi:very-short-patch-repair endonuclease